MQNPAVTFTGMRQVAIEDAEVPRVGPGQMLARTRVSMISTGTELTLLEGDYPPDSFWEHCGGFPLRPGYCNVGRVEAVGEGVDTSWLGRRVASYGNHQRYVITDPASARPVPEGVEELHAPFFAIAEIVMNAVRRSQLRWGESAVIFGAGLLGQLAARFCRLCGARPVVVVDPSAPRLGLLPTGDPALVALNPTEVDPVERVRELTAGRLADVAFEITGVASLIPEETRVVHPQGRLVILGCPRGATSFDFHDLCNANSLTIIGAHNTSTPQVETPGNPWTWQRHAALFFDLLVTGEVDVAPLVTHREPYAQAPALYDMLLSRQGLAMGVLLTWD